MKLNNKVIYGDTVEKHSGEGEVAYFNRAAAEVNASNALLINQEIKNPRLRLARLVRDVEDIARLAIIFFLLGIVLFLFGSEDLQNAFYILVFILTFKSSLEIWFGYNDIMYMQGLTKNFIITPAQIRSAILRAMANAFRW